MGGGDQRLCVGGVVEHFQLAVVHINAGVPPDVGPGDHFQHLAGGDPQAGAETGGPLEDVVVGGDAVQRHQPAHGGTGDDGIAPVGEGAVVFVDVGLEHLDHPVHIHIALAPDFSQGAVLIVQGGVLHQTAVALVVAFHRHDDQVLFAFLHEFVHTPGLAVGGVLVEEYVVAVEHVHHGIAAVSLRFIGLWKVKIRGSFGVAGQLGNGNIPLFNHETDPL